ncbi:MAG: cytochrome c3 family protein, partial [Bacteroidales bacterium]
MKKTSTLFVLLPILVFTGFIGTITPDFSLIKVNVLTVPSNFQKPGENPVCVDCHSDLIESKNVHKPASDSCGTCHAVDIIDHTKNGARGLKLQKNVPALCFGCHKDKEEQFSGLKNVHKAVNVSKSCNNC